MAHEKEKELFIHWYYSVAEWQDFMKLERRKKETPVLVEGLFFSMLGLLINRFGINASWFTSLCISGAIFIIYTLLRYYIRLHTLKWKGVKMPEITITSGIATVNGKSTIFHGDDKWLRKVDIKEVNNLNILEFIYEWRAETGVSFDELRIPVPKGRLREAVEALDRLRAVSSELRATY
jgi:hypothetical protein